MEKFNETKVQIIQKSKEQIKKEKFRLEEDFSSLKKELSTTDQKYTSLKKEYEEQVRSYENIKELSKSFPRYKQNLKQEFFNNEIELGSNVPRAVKMTYKLLCCNSGFCSNL